MTTPKVTVGGNMTPAPAGTATDEGGFDAPAPSTGERAPSLAEIERLMMELCDTAADEAWLSNYYYANPKLASRRAAILSAIRALSRSPSSQESGDARDAVVEAARAVAAVKDRDLNAGTWDEVHALRRALAALSGYPSDTTKENKP